MALTQWLPKSRRGGGEYNTNNLTIPAGMDYVHVQLDVNLSDFDAPDKSVTATVERSADGAATWVHHLTVGWVGGTPGRSGTWEAGTGDLHLYAGQLVRVHFSTSGDFRWGLLGELI